MTRGSIPKEAYACGPNPKPSGKLRIEKRPVVTDNESRWVRVLQQEWEGFAGRVWCDVPEVEKVQ